MEILEIKTTESMFFFWKYFIEIPFVGSSANKVFAKCINGEYELCSLTVDGEIIGVLITEYNDNNLASVIGTYFKGYGRHTEKIIGYYINRGIKKMNFVSAHSEEFCKSWTKADRKWSYYEREL